MSVLVSTGLNVHRPESLASEPMDNILVGISEGRWASQVQAVRKLDYKSSEQRDAKERLPYWTPSGLFGYRSAAGLIEHSGHVAVDLDGLGENCAVATIQKAVADPFCKAAFRSVTGKGARLIFPCPQCTPDAHRLVFGRVAEHVRATYGLEADTSGSDVARPCFVSFDKGLWLNPGAQMLPGLEEAAKLDCQGQTTHKDFLIPVCSWCLTEGDRNTLAFGLGESRAPFALKPDGTCYTHEMLRDLARDLVVRFRRHGLELTLQEIDRAFQAWWSTGKRKGMKFRQGPDAYREELFRAVRCVQGVHWLDRVVNFWLRWTQEPDFPVVGSSEERLEYAIRRHCAQAGTDRFCLSARDAANITGTCFKAANETLHRLTDRGILERLAKPSLARHAQEFRLRH